MEKLPKFGDIIDVRTGRDIDYYKRTLLAFNNGKALCVSDGDEEDYYNNRIFSVCFWDEWREIKKPEYVPFTVKDADMFRGKWIRNKKSDLAGEELITSIKRCGIETDSTNRDYLYFLKYYTFLDGSPCGKLEEVE